MINLTIVTAAWNAINLPKVIESVDNQTIKGFQHIIINDNSPEVRECFKQLCNGVNRHWIDLGVRTHYYGALARDIGVIVSFSYIHHSKRDIENEWIAFHDDDNYWLPNHLESMVDMIEKNKEATMVASDMELVGRTDKSFRKIVPCWIKHGHCDLGEFLYKTKLFRQYGYFFPHPHRKHKYDYELIKKMADGEGENLVYTRKSTLLMTYKKK